LKNQGRIISNISLEKLILLDQYFYKSSGWTTLTRRLDRDLFTWTQTRQQN
jgi:hypothetical protein